MTHTHSGWQSTVVGEMLARFDHYLPDIELINRLAGLLDLRNIITLFNSDCDDREVLINGWGDDDARWLVENYFPQLDAFAVCAQSLAVKHWLRDNVGLFTHTDEQSGKQHVRLVGEGSIFEALFKNPGACSQPIDQYLHIADYMIAFAYNQSNTERAGSKMSRIKVGLRPMTHN